MDANRFNQGLPQPIEGLNALHHKGVMIGNLSTANFLVTDDASISFIDCDAYHLQSRDGRTYPCEVRTDLFTAPELLEQSPDQVVREPCELIDAVLFYEILMLGHTLFSSIRARPGQQLRSGNARLGGSFLQIADGSLAKSMVHDLQSQGLFQKLFEKVIQSKCQTCPARWKKAMLQCMYVMNNPETENSSELLLVLQTKLRRR